MWYNEIRLYAQKILIFVGSNVNTIEKANVITYKERQFFTFNLLSPLHFHSASET